MSLESIAATVVPLIGVALGIFGSNIAAARQAQSAASIALEQIKSQQLLARQQGIHDLELERERHRRERLEEAYVQLMVWCSSLEATVNSVWAACSEPESRDASRARLVVDDWPSSVLVEPLAAAGHRHYWSKEVYELLDQFRGSSGRFVLLAHTLLGPHATGAEREESVRLSSIQQVFEARTTLLTILRCIVEKAHDEVFRGAHAQPTMPRLD